MNDQISRSSDGGERARPKAVFTIIEKPGREKGYWCRIGSAFVNRDQSLSVKLDAMPVNGTLHIRDQQERDAEDERRPASSTGSGGTSGARRDDFALRSPAAAGAAR